MCLTWAADSAWLLTHLSMRVATAERVSAVMQTLNLGSPPALLSLHGLGSCCSTRTIQSPAHIAAQLAELGTSQPLLSYERLGSVAGSAPTQWNWTRLFDAACFVCGSIPIRHMVVPQCSDTPWHTKRPSKFCVENLTAATDAIEFPPLPDIRRKHVMPPLAGDPPS